MSHHPFSLVGRVALVTGASRGLGWAMAEQLAAAGAHVVLNSRDAVALTKQAKLLHDRGQKASVEAFDVTDSHAAELAVERIVKAHGRLDILVGNAGIQHRNAIEDWKGDDWDRVTDANLKACFFLAQAAAKPMKAQKFGRIIFTTSITGLLGRATIHAYVASKAGLAAITRSLAAELGESGITSNSICPGYFETEINTALLSDEAFVTRINNRTALKRWGKPAELGGAAVFLASDAAGYITGHQLVIDGGFTSTM